MQGEVRLWAMQSRELLSTLKEHQQPVTALVRELHCLKATDDDAIYLTGSVCG